MPASSFSTTTVLGYSQIELALVCLCALALAYYKKTGHWPKLAPHDGPGDVVWL